MAVGDLLWRSDDYANSHVNNNNSIKEYSFLHEKEARASAYAISPPVMLPFDQRKECTICARTFTFFNVHNIAAIVGL